MDPEPDSIKATRILIEMMAASVKRGQTWDQLVADNGDALGELHARIVGPDGPQTARPSTPKLNRLRAALTPTPQTARRERLR